MESKRVDLMSPPIICRTAVIINGVHITLFGDEETKVSNGGILLTDDPVSLAQCWENVV